ncbi:MAG: ATP-dependent Clp protease adaptor ClpS [Bacteroidales bacterium]|nr:ATP-dependent Clp protease adaptor ClpS [Bacteroidales bacterium]
MTTGSLHTPETEDKVSEELLDTLDDGCTLMLFNDNIHTFDFVIDNLMELCRHTYEQALQCAWITHCYGKCDVLHGSREKVSGVAGIMSRRGLTVKII